MIWIFFLLLQAVFIVRGIRQEQATGEWSWSKFLFTLCFAALECVLVIAPIFFVPLTSPWFLKIYGLAWVIAGLNFIWFIRACRQWKLPDGRTSLEAARGVPPPTKRA
jgi:hypothetical protein